MSTFTGVVFSGMGTGGLLWSNMLGKITEAHGWRVALRTTALVTGSLLLFPIVIIGYSSDLGVQNEDNEGYCDNEKQKDLEHRGMRLPIPEQPSKQRLLGSTGQQVDVNKKEPSALLDTLKNPSLLAAAFSFLLFLLAANG